MVDWLIVEIFFETFFSASVEIELISKIFHRKTIKTNPTLSKVVRSLTVIISLHFLQPL